MFNKCHLIWKWATRKTIFWHNSCIGIYMKWLQVKSRKIKRSSMHWGMQSNIGNTWVPVKIICILDYCKTKACLIGVVSSRGLLLFHADVIRGYISAQEVDSKVGQLIYLLRRLTSIPVFILEIIALVLTFFGIRRQFLKSVHIFPMANQMWQDRQQLIIYHFLNTVPRAGHLTWKYRK